MIGRAQLYIYLYLYYFLDNMYLFTIKNLVFIHNLCFFFTEYITNVKMLYISFYMLLVIKYIVTIYVTK